MISFIITCYNNVDILERCLSSFLWQTPGLEFEVILIDNNSDKENIDRAYLYFFNKFPITLVKQPKLPSTVAVGRARNLGFKIAKYPWIASLDSDLVINKDYIKTIYSYIKNNQNIILTGERIFVTYDKDQFTLESDYESAIAGLTPIKSISNYNVLIDRRREGLRQLAKHPHPWSLMHGGICIYNKEKALEIKGYDESYDGHWGYEDIEFAYRLITETGCIPKCDEKLYCYHLENLNEVRDQQRFDKINNPNWAKICAKIPGFKEFKEQEYRSLSKQIIV